MPSNPQTLGVPHFQHPQHSPRASRQPLMPRAALPDLPTAAPAFQTPQSKAPHRAGPHAPPLSPAASPVLEAGPQAVRVLGRLVRAQLAHGPRRPRRWLPGQPRPLPPPAPRVTAAPPRAWGLLLCVCFFLKKRSIFLQ